MEEIKLLGDNVESPSLVNEKYTEDFLNRAIKKEELKSLEQDRKYRGWFAIGISIFVAVYVFTIMVIVFRCGNYSYNFNLDNSVLITLLSTTTANIVGLLAFVVRYLFHNK